MKLLKVFTKPNILILFFLIIATFISYLIEFNLKANSNQYFWCVNVKNDFVLPIIGNIKLPIHCDEGPYLSAISSVEYFFSEVNPYQKRPLWILSLSSIFSLYTFIFDPLLSEYQIFRLTTFTLQLMVSFFISKLLVDYLKINTSKLLNYFPIFVLVLFPYIRWNIFFPSHGNLTLLATILSLYIMKNGFIEVNNINLTYIILGILTLAHRSFLAFGFLLLIYFIYHRNLKVRKFYSVLQLMLPTILYEMFVYISPYNSYDWNKAEYNQFYWILDLFQSKQTKTSGEFCQSFQTFFVCNLEITFNYLYLFMIPISFLIVLLITTKLLNKNISYLSDLLYISIGIYFFWSVQGWYPEFRFINYSVGYLILLSLIMTIEKLDGKKYIGYSSLIIFYFSIDYLQPYSLVGLELNAINIISIFMFCLYLLNLVSIKRK